jgi:DNA-binding MarR family transcriptional regulator
VSENNRRARFYTLTTRGERELAAEADTWRRYAETVGAILARGTA